MRFTGERLVSGIPRLENMIVEELARLNFVRPYLEGRTVLDAGCGAGYGTSFMAGNGARWVLGVDISEEAIQCAASGHARDNLEFGVADCTELGLRDDSFDMVVSIELIEHLVQVDRYLSEVCRVVKPQGLYFMSTPNRRISSTADGKASWAFHEREFTPVELADLLGSYFEEVEIWGSFVPVYEDHPVRRVTKSPLSQIKHILPPKLRLWVSSSIRFWIKPELEFDDVAFSKNSIDDAPTLVALCSQKRRLPGTHAANLDDLSLAADG
jgi:ubiquinone/menaquinone biosynthesis C-methylase UbiE